jgi:hypothetical protein
MYILCVLLCPFKIYDVIAGTLTTAGYEEHQKLNEVEKTIEEQDNR